MTIGRELPLDGYTRSGTAGKPLALPRRRGLSHLPVIGTQAAVRRRERAEIAGDPVTSRC